jgi:hypothetical protein
MDDGVMTFSHSLTIAGWIVIAIAFAAAWAGALVSRGRFPNAIALLRAAMRNVVVRGVALAGWAWVGWHFFVRTSR